MINNNRFNEKAFQKVDQKKKDPRQVFVEAAFTRMDSIVGAGWQDSTY